MNDSPLADTLHEIGTVGDFEIGKAKRVEIAGRMIAVWHLEDGFFALDDSCPHAGAPLGFGQVEEGTVICPRHGAHFDIRTGKVLSLPAVHGLKRFAVTVENDKVMIDDKPVDDAPPDILRLF